MNMKIFPVFLAGIILGSLITFLYVKPAKLPERVQQLVKYEMLKEQKIDIVKKEKQQALDEAENLPTNKRLQIADKYDRKIRDILGGYAR
jgi:hypothetical protein